jgi:hypothetical protein
MLGLGAFLGTPTLPHHNISVFYTNCALKPNPGNRECLDKLSTVVEPKARAEVGGVVPFPHFIQQW